MSLEDGTTWVEQGNYLWSAPGTEEGSFPVCVIAAVELGESPGGSKSWVYVTRCRATHYSEVIGGPPCISLTYPTGGTRCPNCFP